MSSQFITIEDITFHILHEGPGTTAQDASSSSTSDQNPKKPISLLVLSHALMSNLHMYDMLCPILHAAGYSTLRYDHVGHGMTKFPADTASTNAKKSRYHFDDFTRHIHLLAQHIISTSTTTYELRGVIGCSMGGVLALRYAMLFPPPPQSDQPRLAIVSSSIPAMSSVPATIPLWSSRIAKWRTEGSNENLARLTVERWFPEPCAAEVKQEALRQNTTCSFEGYEACADGIMEYDYAGELQDIGVGSGDGGGGERAAIDIVVVVGDRDEAVGGGVEGLRKGTVEPLQQGGGPGCEFVVLDGIGHIPPMQDSRRFGEVVLRLLEK